MTRTSLAIAVALAAALVSAETWVVEGRVIGVSDGDTITVLERSNRQHKIRLSGIDAPERGQAFGVRAKESQSRLAFDRQLQAYCHKKNRYGRAICKVMRSWGSVSTPPRRSSPTDTYCPAIATLALARPETCRH
jgi:endonuclease YncB( thermonuclease family)